MDETQARLSNPTTDSVEPESLDVVCPACGCLCDDGRVATLADRVVAAEALCPKGLAWFQLQADRRRLDAPIAAIDGAPCSIDAALDHATRLLNKARAPIVLGLNAAGIETARLAVAFADSRNARIHLGDNRATLQAFQNVGRVSSTWGEVKQRADFALFWFVDPIATHPRFLERFLARPPKRSIVVADSQTNQTSSIADRFQAISPGRRIETLRAVRAQRAGLKVDEPFLEEFADMLMHATHGALFFDPSELSQVELEEIFLLTRDLNHPGRRFVALELGAPGNPTGADAVLTWQTGYSGAVDFSKGYPRPITGDWADTDLALVVADDFQRFAPQLKHASTIVFAPDATEHAVNVAVRTKTPCFDADATYVRADGVWLPVRAPFRSDLPSDRSLLEKLLESTAARGFAETTKETRS